MTHRAYLFGPEGAAMSGRQRVACIKPIDNGKRGLYSHDHMGRFDIQVGGRERTVELMRGAQDSTKLVALDVPFVEGDTILLMESARFAADLDGMPARALRDTDPFVLHGQPEPEGIELGRWRSPDKVPVFTCRHALRVASVEVLRLRWLSEETAAACGYLADTHATAVQRLEIGWMRRYGQSDNQPDRNPWVWVIEGERLNAAKDGDL